jgi:hypothetical protein
MITPPPPSSPYHQSPRTRYTENDYENIFYHFDDYATDILFDHVDDILQERQHEEHYEAEDKILDEVSRYEFESIKRSALFGLGCGVTTFGLLRWRRSGWGLSPYASRSSSGGYKFDPVDKNTVNTYQQQTQSYNTPKSSGLLLHTTLSTILTAGISILAIETDIFYPIKVDENTTDLDTFPPPQWISPQLPLVPGRSMISDLLCQPLTQEFRKFPKELWQSGNSNGFEAGYNNHIALYANGGWRDSKYYNSNPNASVVSLGEKRGESLDGTKGIYEQLVLDSLQGFIINCERRARYEKKLRRLRGDRRDSPVVIPRDGVPADEDLELDDIYFQEEEGDDDRFGL